MASRTMVRIDTNIDVEGDGKEKEDDVKEVNLFAQLDFTHFLFTNLMPPFKQGDEGVTAGHGLTAKVMHLWHHRAKGLNHDYALVGYLLSPNPSIMNHAKQNRTTQHDEAVSRLITKLLLPDDEVGESRNRTRSRLVHSFWKEFTEFSTRSGVFADPDMWFIAEDPTVESHEQWNTYGRIRTTVIGKLACLVLPKNLGIGSAERHWKLVKAAKAGQ